MNGRQVVRRSLSAGACAGAVVLASPEAYGPWLAVAAAALGWWATLRIPLRQYDARRCPACRLLVEVGSGPHLRPNGRDRCSGHPRGRVELVRVVGTMTLLQTALWGLGRGWAHVARAVGRAVALAPVVLLTSCTDGQVRLAQAVAVGVAALAAFPLGMLLARLVETFPGLGDPDEPALREFQERHARTAERCPSCGSSAFVVNTERRQCSNCRRSWTAVDPPGGEPGALLEACPHGGLARGGVCILDATHPPVPCLVCGEGVCPCRACREDHRHRRGHMFQEPAMWVGPPAAPEDVFGGWNPQPARLPGPTSGPVAGPARASRSYRPD